MKKVLSILICGLVLCGITGCGKKKTLDLKDQLKKVNEEIIKYFLDGKQLDNYVANYIDEKNNVVIVELIDNSEAKQDEFRKKVVDSEYIKFIKGELVTTDIAITYEKTILDNMDSIMEVSDSSSSNPYDYIDNDHYRSIVALGSGAVPVLEEMYNSGKLTGLKAYISALAIEDITDCHLSTKYNWSSAEEFYNLWKTETCEFKN